MEQKINHQKLFPFIPSTITSFVIETLSSTNPTHPIYKQFPYSLTMLIQINGFLDLISHFIITDDKQQKPQLHCEYLSFSFTRLILQISAIITQYHGDIVKYSSDSFLVFWNYHSEQNEVNSILNILQCVMAIDKKVNSQEIFKGIKVNILIGIGMGKTTLSIIGGAKNRSEYIFIDEAIDEMEQCIKTAEEIYKNNNNKEPPINNGSIMIIPRKIMHKLGTYSSCIEIIKDSNHITNNSPYAQINTENSKIEISLCKLEQNLTLYDSIGGSNQIISNNIYKLLRSLIPYAAFQHIDLDYEHSINEIRTVTIMSMLIIPEDRSSQNIKHLQKIISYTQECIYLTQGSLLSITTKMHSLFIRCLWGVPPFSFSDDPCRCVSTVHHLYHTLKQLNCSLVIGITTGHCGVKLLTIQASKKILSVLGTKVLIADYLMEVANDKIKEELYDASNPFKVLSYVDKITMQLCAKYYRFSYEGSIKVKNNNKTKKLFSYYKPIFDNDYFKPSQMDPFPLIRTHKFNSYSPKELSHYKEQNEEKMETSFIPELRRKSYRRINNKKSKQQKDSSLNVSGIKNMTELLDNKNDLNDSFSSVSSLSEMDVQTYRLKKSQMIFGYSNEINTLVSILNQIYLIKGKKLIYIQGFPGSGKSLFIRKCLNNFIGMNESIAANYFTDNHFVFVSNQNYILKFIPYNSIAYIIRKIYMKLIYLKKQFEIKEFITQSKFSDSIISKIQFILSLGLNDINLYKDLSLQTSNLSESILSQYEFSIDIYGQTFQITNYEGINITNFFIYIISIYRLHQKKTHNLPLILIFEDIQVADAYSLSFLTELYNKNISVLFPLIIITSFQIPLHPFLTDNISQNVLFTYEIFKNIHFLNNNNSDTNLISNLNNISVIGFNMHSLQNKTHLEKMIIFCFKDLVMKTYKTNLERVDSKILEIIQQKTFFGNPLLSINLIQSLINSEKYIQTLSGEFIVTSELLDNNEILEWSNNFVIPVLYEKIYGELLDCLFNQKQIIILKRASIIGTLFDVATLDDINPFKNNMNVDAMCELLFKAENADLLEKFNDYYGKNKKLVFKFSFPLFRECLYQRIPLEVRTNLHLIIAKFIETSKVKFFSKDKENKMIRRHLEISEMSLINEIEKRKVKTIEELVKSKDVLNVNNLKIILVKGICSNFHSKNKKLFLEGYLYKKGENKQTWERRYFILDNKNMAYYYTSDDYMKNTKNLPLGKYNLNSIFKAEVISDYGVINDMCIPGCELVLEVGVANWEKKGIAKERRIYYYNAEKREDVYKWAISLNFLKVKAKYDEYIENFDFVKFPLYKKNIYNNKKYVMNLNTLRFDKGNIFKKKKHCRNSVDNCSTNTGQILSEEFLLYKDVETIHQRVLKEAKIYYNPLTIIVRSSFSVIIGIIQSQIKRQIGKMNMRYNGNVKEFYTPLFLEDTLEQFFENLKSKRSDKQIMFNNSNNEQEINTNTVVNASNNENINFSDNYSIEDEISNDENINRKNTHTIKYANKKQTKNILDFIEDSISNEVEIDNNNIFSSINNIDINDIENDNNSKNSFASFQQNLLESPNKSPVNSMKQNDKRTCRTEYKSKKKQIDVLSFPSDFYPKKSIVQRNEYLFKKTCENETQCNKFVTKNSTLFQENNIVVINNYVPQNYEKKLMEVNGNFQEKNVFNERKYAYVQRGNTIHGKVHKSNLFSKLKQMK